MKKHRLVWGSQGGLHPLELCHAVEDGLGVRITSYVFVNKVMILTTSKGDKVYLGSKSGSQGLHFCWTSFLVEPEELDSRFVS